MLTADKAPMTRDEQNSLQAKFDCLTDPQKDRLVLWSIQYDQSLRDILRTLRPDYFGDSYAGLVGMLPCGLYGCLHPTGSVHT